MLVYLARHAQSNANKDLLIQGHLDYPLSHEGIAQANLLGKRLQTVEFKHIITTHLQRAKTTAEIIATYQSNPIPIQIESRLAERNYGCWENMAYTDIAEKYPALFHAWYTNPAKAIIPDAEPLEYFRSRVLEAFYNYVESLPEPILFVVHGGTILTIIANFLGTDDSNYWRIRATNTGLSLLNLRNSRPCIEFLNDTSHLMT